jgi:hypothetical protein
MTKRVGTLARAASAGVSALAIALLAGMAISPNAVAGEAEAKALLKAMSTYMAEQKALSFEYDANLEIVTRDKQKLALASSGAVALSRPDKIRATRSGGFLDTETVFDGKTLTLLGKNKNIYTQVDIPGSIDHLVDELKDKYNRPLPAADLLLTNAYDELMSGVVDVKDLGSGVIGGTECDHLAFRKRKSTCKSGSPRETARILADMSLRPGSLRTPPSTAFRSGTGRPAETARLTPSASRHRQGPSR